LLAALAAGRWPLAAGRWPLAALAARHGGGGSWLKVKNCGCLLYTEEVKTAK